MNLFKKISLFYFSIKDIPLNKLLNRLKLNFKRKVLPIFLRNSRKTFKHEGNFNKNPNYKNIKSNIYKKHFIKTHNGYDFEFLNEAKSFENNFDWNKKGLNKGTRLWKLNLHYFHWIVNASDEDFNFFINDWIDKNRPYQKEYWLDSWNSYALSIRICTWMNEITKRSKSLDSNFVKKVDLSIIEQANFLKNNLELDIGGNHLIKNIKALLLAGSYFKGKNSDRWREIGSNYLSKELKKQILSDGFHFELSPSYHCDVFEDLMDCYVYLDNSNIKKTLYNKLYDMAIVIKSFTHSDGYISLFNDGGLHMASNPNSLLIKYNEIFKIDILNENERLSFEDSGYFVVKNKLFHFIYDSGNVGPDELPGHSQGDIFSFELSVKKQRVFVDTGVFEYDSGPKRNLSRATKSHNTLTINDLDQCEFFSSFRMAKRAKVEVEEIKRSKEQFYIRSNHDGYRNLNGNPIHRRILQCNEVGEINIHDKVIGGKNQKVISRILLHPEIDINFSSKNKLILLGEGFKILITSSLNNIKIEESNWWPNFGEEFKTNRIVFNHGNTPCEANVKIQIINI